MSDNSVAFLHGAPTWIDISQADLAQGQVFYRELFGWTFGPPQSRGSSRVSYASVDREIFGSMSWGDRDPGWVVYFDVEHLPSAVNSVLARGGRDASAVKSFPGLGQWVTLADREGVRLGLWQSAVAPKLRVGSRPNAWRYTTLRSPRPSLSVDWYVELFDWHPMNEDAATVMTLPGLGARLRRSGEPGIAARLDVPDDFDDAVAWIVANAGDHLWYPVFSVTSRDDTAERALDLGGAVIQAVDQSNTYNAVVRDPQGAIFGISQPMPGTHYTPNQGDMRARRTRRTRVAP